MEDHVVKLLMSTMASLTSLRLYVGRHLENEVKDEVDEMFERIMMQLLDF